jgi:hypothetical protein
MLFYLAGQSMFVRVAVTAMQYNKHAVRLTFCGTAPVQWGVVSSYDQLWTKPWLKDKAKKLERHISNYDSYGICRYDGCEQVLAQIALQQKQLGDENQALKDKHNMQIQQIMQLQVLASTPW